MEQKPSVGRIVHYFETETSKPLAAMINTISEQEGLVHLTVFKETYMAWAVNTPHRSMSRAGHPMGFWDWPERT